MAMCFVPNVYYVCLACAAILEYCKCCKEKNTTTIKGQLISKGLFNILNSSKNEQKISAPVG